MTPGANVIKLFMPQVTNPRNTLECSLLASLSSLACCLWARPGTYPRVGSCLTCKHYTILERLEGDKHSSLSRKFVTDGHKIFYNIGPWFHCYKTFFYTSPLNITVTE